MCLTDMGTRLAWALTALTAALLAVGELFTLLGREYLERSNLIANVGFIFPILTFAIVGALIATRRPGDQIGWICAAIALLFAIVVAADALSSWGVGTGSLSQPVNDWLGWL